MVFRKTKFHSLAERLDWENQQRLTVGGSPFLRRIRQALTLTMLVVIGYYSYTILAPFLVKPDGHGNPKVFDLGMNNAIWDVFYGVSPKCAKIDCHLTGSMPSDEYTSHLILPSHDYKTREHKPGEFLYYRILLSLPPETYENAEFMTFHSLHIWAAKYEFYVNEKLIEVGGRQQLDIGFPVSEIGPKGQLLISVKVDPGNYINQGLSHFGSILVGPQAELQYLANYAIQYRTVFNYWFLIPKLTLCVLFGFFYLAMPRGKEQYSFLFYGVLGSISIFLRTAAADDLLPVNFQSGALAAGIECLAQLALINFLYNYYRRYSRIYLAIFPFAALVLAVWIARPFFQADTISLNSHVVTLRSILRFSAIGFGMYLSLVSIRYLSKSQKSQIRLRSSKILLTFFSFYLAMSIIQEAGLIQVGIRGAVSFACELMIFIILAALIAMEFGLSITQRNTIKESLDRYVDVKVADKLMNKELAQLQTHSLRVSVLFCDIRGFTSHTETHHPDAILSLLNEFVSGVSQIVRESRGMVSKFIGDEVMAVWGAPSSHADDANNAVRCAVRLGAFVTDLNKRRAARGDFPIKVGIGVNTGQVIAGEVGDKTRAEYTVIGDTVNVAARLQNLTKEVDYDLLISAETLAHVQQEVWCIDSGLFEIRGKKTSVRALKLLAVRDEDGKTTIAFNNSNDEFLKSHPDPLVLSEEDFQAEIFTRTA